MNSKNCYTKLGEETYNSGTSHYQIGFKTIQGKDIFQKKKNDDPDRQLVN